MPDPLITAAMIMRDEARHLPACLQSIRELVDEVVVVDTGSVDTSVLIAESFGARVAHHPWDGSFAAPRNLGLDLARGEWILYIDADERLRPTDPGPIRAMLQAAPELAFRIQLTPFADSTPYWEYRLWRSDPRIRFAGRMHEKVAPVIEQISAAEGREIGLAPLSLAHVGYDGDQAHKHRRNLPMLRARLAEDPSDAYNWRHLSIVLAELGESDASQEALARAVAEATSAPHHVGALVFAELIAQRRRQGEDVGELIGTAIRLYPDSIGLLWQRVLHDIEQERYEDALRSLDRFDVDPDRPVEDTIAYRRALFLVDSQDARGLCLFRLGRYAEAADAYRRAEDHEPGDLGRRVRRQLAEHRAVGLSPAGSPDAARAVGGKGVAPRPRPVAAADPPVRWSAQELIDGITLDVAGVPIRCAASDAMRARALHALLSAAPRASRAPVAELRFGRQPPPLRTRHPDENFGTTRVWHDEVLSVAYDQRIIAKVDGPQAMIGGAGADLTRACHAIGPFVLGRLLAPHGRFLMHGAAVRYEGSSILLLGGSGAGKSTLVYGALMAGWDVYSDDLVIVARSDAGPELTGLPRPMHVPSEVGVGGIHTGRPTIDGRGRIELDFDGWTPGRHPIAAVGVVGHGGAERPIIDVLPRPGLLGLTVASMLSRRPADVTAFFPLAVAIGDRPNFRLRHGTAVTARAADSISAVTRWFAGGTPDGERRD